MVEIGFGSSPRGWLSHGSSETVERLVATLLEGLVCFLDFPVLACQGRPPADPFLRLWPGWRRCCNFLGPSDTTGNWLVLGGLLPLRLSSMSLRRVPSIRMRRIICLVAHKGFQFFASLGLFLRSGDRIVPSY